MKIETYTSDDVFQHLKAEWNDLLQHSRSNRVFLTWEWQSSWWKVYHPGDLWVLAVRDDAGQLVGLAPWFIENMEKTGRTIRGIGCVDVTDYLETIAHADCEAAVFQTLAAHVKAHHADFDTIDLCNIPQDSPVLEFFPSALESNGLSVQIKQQEVCPIIQLPDSWESYVSSLNKKNRHELRRKIRKAGAADESVDSYTIGAEHNLGVEIEHFLNLMRTASAEKVEFLENEKNVTFFRTIIPVMAEAGWLHLSFLTIGGNYAAAYLNFDYNQEILVYNSGLDLSVGSNLSPGIVLLGYLIQDAIERGRTHFDFLRGDEDYKYRMGGQDTRVFMLIAA